MNLLPYLGFTFSCTLINNSQEYQFKKNNFLSLQERKLGIFSLLKIQKGMFTEFQEVGMKKLLKKGIRCIS